MQTNRLRVFLIAIFLQLQIASVVAILQGVSTQTREQLDENARQSLMRLGIAVADRAHSYLANASGTTTMLAEMSAQGLLDTGDSAALISGFLPVLKSRDAMGNLYLGRPDGSFLFVTRDPDSGSGFEVREVVVSDTGEHTAVYRRLDDNGALIDTWTPEGRVPDPRERPWYQLATTTTGHVWTDPYVFVRSGQPVITSTIAVRDANGETVGVIGADVRITEFSRYLRDMTEAGSSSAMIIDADDRILAHSDPQLVDTTSEESLPSIGSLGDSDFEHLLATAVNHEAMHIGVVPAEEPAEGETLVMVRPLWPLGHDNKASWRLLVKIPTRDYEADLTSSIDRKLTLFVTVLAVFSLLSGGAVWKLTEPLKRLARDAGTDPLTGALNRREFEHSVLRLIASRERQATPDKLVLVALDLDGFKPVNDSVGHAVGDELLRDFTRRLGGGLRSNDLLARTGGDEFVVMLELDASADAFDIVERLRHRAVDAPFLINGKGHRIGVTAGLAEHRHGESLASLMKRADQALIVGKATAKNRSYRALDTTVSDSAAVDAKATDTLSAS
ncbi:MAG: hypothetical protein CSB44_12890 [Gammaproteobacteria bacterium]|nr:MAG: hypothetical protein CSB44_12890 [Gammaproteobacteria bacterium]